MTLSVGWMKRREVKVIKFSAEQVAAGEHEALSPDRYDFVWSDDYTTCTAVPLLWWDDKSYAAWQSAE